MQLTENFSLSEFNSKCGRPMPANVQKNIAELAKNLQVLRNELKSRITITSGYRSPEHNASPRVKGARNSQHLLGTASDIHVAGYAPYQVAQAIERLIFEGKMKQGGLKAYKSFTHYDIRGVRARW
jgi:uncharacterized protein YcbK (DUF882 family)